MTEINEKLTEEIDERQKFSLWTHISYILMSQPTGALAGMFSAYYLFFYESELNMSVGLIATGYTIFVIWDAINDVIVGHLSDKQTRFTKKWGRRFPWIIAGFIPLILGFLLIWIPPQGSEIIHFIWFVGTICLYETGVTMTQAPLFALFAEKFRSEKERMRNSALTPYVGLITFAIGAILPPLIIQIGVTSSYFVAALIILIPCLLFIILGIHGCREDTASIESSLKSIEHAKETKMSLGKVLKTVLRSKNFLRFSIIALIFTTGMTLFNTTLLYYLLYIAHIDAGMLGLISLSGFIMILVSTPVWLIISKKISKKAILLSGLFVFIPIYLAYSISGLNLTMMFVLECVKGIFFGGFMIALLPTLSETVDEIAVQTEQMNPGAYMGIYSLIQRLGYLLPPIIIAIIFNLTGFNSEGGIIDISQSAINGILGAMSWVPAILVLLAIPLGLTYDIDKKKSQELKLKLHELDI